MGTAVRVAGATKRTSSGVVERCSPHFVSGLIRFHIDGFHIDAPPQKLSCAHDWCDQMQSGRCTALQLKESTKSMPCTQKGRVAHIHSYVLGGETGPSLLDETTLSFLDGQAMTAHAALCLCHESTWQSQRCLARAKMDGLTQSVDEKMQSKVDTSTVDGKYNQSGSIWKELSGGFHCPPYPPNSKLGYSG